MEKYIYITVSEKQNKNASFCIFSTGCVTAVLEKTVVLLWLQLWDQTPHTWEKWIWTIINQEFQGWSNSLG